MDELPQTVDALLRDALSAVSQGILVIDKQMNVAFYNRRYGEFFDFPEDMFPVGTPLEELLRFYGETGEFGDGDIQAEIDLRLQSAKDGVASNLSRQKPDGRYMHATGHPMSNGSYVYTFTDVTEQMLERQKLANFVSELTTAIDAATDAEKNTRAFLDATGDSAVLVDLQGKIVVANETAAKQMGMPLDKLIGTNLFEISTTESAARRRRKIQEVVKSKVPLFDPAMFDPRENTWAEGSVYPVLDDRGNVIRVAFISREVTTRIEMEEAAIQARDAAEAANLSKTEFLANMSHELRTPLNAILGYAEIMSDGLYGKLDNEKYEQYVEFIAQSGRHLHALINDILDVASLETGNLTLKETECSLLEMVASVSDMLRHSAEDQDIRLINQLDNLNVKIYADQRRILQVLTNILSNAVKYTKPGGSVTLSARREEGGSLSIEISDTGIGMDKAGLEKAFTKFGQVDSDLAREQEGAGLGLPLAKDLIEAHGGELIFESVLRKGTKVQIRIPAERILD